MKTTVPIIKPERVLGDLATLRSMGAYRSGVHRPTFSPDDLAAREWLVERMREAGLDAGIDEIGNVLGRSGAKGRKMLSGSHIETQNHAGWLDGALGVIYALEAARAITEADIMGGPGVDVVVLCDEEGHFGSFLGSRSFIGVLDEDEIDKAANVYDGTPLRAALADAGYAGRPRFLIESERYAGFFEAHIEQGDRLETSGKTIGIVSAIVGIWQYRITAEGEQNHAGTTSMTRRRDAGLALVRLLSAVDRRFPGVAGPRSVWTTGQIVFAPGAKSIIPGRAEALFQFRDADPVVLQRLHDALDDLVTEENRSGPCKLVVNKLSGSLPAHMDERLMQALERAAERHAAGKHVVMASGAGHDAQYLARELPTAMMFVPSIGGISHHWMENTADDDIVLGARVFADAIATALTD